MELVQSRPNVELRQGPDGVANVVLAFPYDAGIVARVRLIPNRRFDWDRREWIAPASDWAAVKVAELLERFPELTVDAAVSQWLSGLRDRWIGYVRTARHDGRGWWALETVAGTLPAALGAEAVEHEGRVLVALNAPGAVEAVRELGSARLSPAALRCLELLELGVDPPPARLVLARGVDGERLLAEVLWDAAIGGAFERLPGATRNGLAPDPWLADRLDAFVAQHEVEVSALAAEVLERLRIEHRAAAEAVRRSRAMDAEPIRDVAARLGGELAPFQWAAVRYALDARRTFLADEQGLGKTVEALAALEADGAFPAVVVCPASMKLVWQREAERWLAHRSVAVVNGRAPVPPSGDVTILNYEIAAAHGAALARRRLRALVVDEAHYCKNPHAKRTQAVRRLAESVVDGGLRLALTGTPVLNHPEELIPQLRIIGRLQDFGSGARFAREFEGQHSEERLHWHLRRRGFVRRLKADVLPQLPAKRQVVVPVALTNETEYRLAETDVIAWLRSQPLDLASLGARIAAALRAERLAQLTALQRLAAAGKLARRPGLDRRLSRLRRAAGRVRPARRDPAGGATSLPQRPAHPRRRCVASSGGGDRRLPGRRRAAADRLRHPRRRPGHHPDPSLERVLPRARVDAGDARPGRGPLPPDRAAGCGHGLVPARGRDDRRDDGRADRAQAGDRVRGDRRTPGGRRQPRRGRGPGAAQRPAAPAPARRGLDRGPRSLSPR